VNGERVNRNRIESAERRDVTSQAIEAASKDPLIVNPIIVRP